MGVQNNSKIQKKTIPYFSQQLWFLVYIIKMGNWCTYNRNYYRCSSGDCQVKKRIERDIEDSSYVITTYTGIHNHPIPGMGYYNQMPLMVPYDYDWTLQASSLSPFSWINSQAVFFPWNYASKSVVYHVSCIMYHVVYVPIMLWKKIRLLLTHFHFCWISNPPPLFFSFPHFGIILEKTFKPQFYFYF